MSSWPRSAEDRLIHRWWQAEHDGCGTLWTEVGIGNAFEGATQRRIDAVLAPTSSTGHRVWARAHQDVFVEDAEASDCVYLVEAKRSLNRGVIGQAVVARALFPVDYPAIKVPTQPAVIAGRDDTALRWAAEQLGVQVFIY